MSVNSVCSRCEVVQSIDVIYKEYREYLDTLNSLDCRTFNDHARGYHVGRIRLTKEITDDLLELMRYLHTLSNIRANQGRL